MICGTPGWGIRTFGGAWAMATSGHDDNAQTAMNALDDVFIVELLPESDNP
jgi:hypothetical protein